jgi:hypothetical protein
LAINTNNGGDTTAISYSMEYNVIYGHLNSSVKVDAAYINLFGRILEPSGLAFFINLPYWFKTLAFRPKGAPRNKRSDVALSGADWGGDVDFFLIFGFIPAGCFLIALLNALCGRLQDRRVRRYLAVHDYYLYPLPAAQIPATELRTLRESLCTAIGTDLHRTSKRYPTSCSTSSTASPIASHSKPNMTVKLTTLINHL